MGNWLLSENEWNYHVDGSGNGHDMKPYKSDSKWQMFGRETGHFGSGTYFSTYRDSEFSNYGERNFNPNFIKIADNVYRVDFDLYKNLYRVRSEKQGDVLYTMCAELNHMYNKIVSMGKFDQRNANYDNSDSYQIIRRNAEALGLRCPSYYELVRMAQRHNGNQSFSTLFMEWNGYNGVNVSGVDAYDNTKHGSVIYDLSKVSDEMREVDVRIPYSFGHQYYKDTIAYDEMREHELAALKGKETWWYDHLNDMPFGRALRILKNYTKSGNVLSWVTMKKLNERLLRMYVSILYHACIGDVMKGGTYGEYSDGKITLSSDWFGRENAILDKIMDYDEKSYYARLINSIGAYYFANVVYKNDSMLTEMLWEFSRTLGWSLSSDEEVKAKKDFLEKVKGSLNRELTKYEREFIEEDYFE